jgi:hypothetical protein
MAPRLLRCAIEEVSELHANFVRGTTRRRLRCRGRPILRASRLFEVECGNVASRWLGKATECRLEVSWQDSGTLVELASVALALILANRVVRLGRLDVTDYGGRAD